MRIDRRYESLDALRGIAAIIVVLFHVGQVKIFADIAPHGYLAVDFFFALSGFVLAQAYEETLLHSLSWHEFALKRAVRIYPVSLLGTIFGMIILLLKWYSFPEKVDPLPQILTSGVLNSMLLPTPFSGKVSGYALFPGNGPLWSLSFEMAANLFWAAWGPWLRTRTLIFIVALSGLAVAACIFEAGNANHGFDLTAVPFAIARISFSFPLGVLIYRARRSVLWPRRLPDNQVMPILLGATLIGALAFPRVTSIPFAVWDVTATLFIMPAIVIFGVAQRSRVRLGNLLGELSYPLYVLHFPILLLASGLHQTKLAGTSPIWIASGSVIVTVILSFIVSRLYDIPIRRWLSGVILPKKQPHVLMENYKSTC